MPDGPLQIEINLEVPLINWRKFGKLLCEAQLKRLWDLNAQHTKLQPSPEAWFFSWQDFTSVTTWTNFICKDSLPKHGNQNQHLTLWSKPLQSIALANRNFLSGWFQNCRCLFNSVPGQSWRCYRDINPSVSKPLEAFILIDIYNLRSASFSLA